MSARSQFSFLFLGVSLLLAGCRSTPGIDQVRAAIEQEHPGVVLEPEETLHLGRLSLGLIKVVARAVLDDDDDNRKTEAMLSTLHRVEVGTYRVRGATADLALPAGLASRLRRNGWQTVVHDRDGSDHSWVFLHEENGTIHALFVASLDGDELDLVAVEGDLDRLFAQALADHPERAAAAFGRASNRGAGK